MLSPHGLRQGAYVDLHFETYIVHGLATGVGHVQIARELLTNQ